MDKWCLAPLPLAWWLPRSGDSAAWFFLAMTHWQQGAAKRQARDWFDWAVRWTADNRPQDGGVAAVLGRSGRSPERGGCVASKAGTGPMNASPSA
jgi:hypothetical protein